MHECTSPTHKMDVAFLSSFVIRRRPSLELSPVGVVRPTESEKQN